MTLMESAPTSEPINQDNVEQLWAKPNLLAKAKKTQGSGTAPWDPPSKIHTILARLQARPTGHQQTASSRVSRKLPWQFSTELEHFREDLSARRQVSEDQRSQVRDVLER